MKLDEKTTTVLRTEPLPTPYRNAIDKSSIGACFVAGFVFVSLFLPWMNYTFIPLCTLSICSAPVSGQINIFGLITSVPAHFKAYSGSFMIEACLLIACFVTTAIALFFLVRSNGLEDVAIKVRKRTSTICLITCIFGLLAAFLITFNIVTAGPAATMGLGLWATVVGLSILTFIIGTQVANSSRISRDVS